MRKFDLRLLLGLVLILIGALFLLEALDVVRIGEWIVGLAFLVGGAAFLYVYFTQRDKWWPLIPGCSLAGIGLGIMASDLLPAMYGLTPFFILGGMGLSFLLVYAARRDNWWALIPGCTLAGIGVAVMAESLLPSFGEIVPFFVLGGIGLSFLLVYFTHREWWWAIIPAGSLFSIALMIVTEPLFREGAGIAGVLFLGLAITFGVLGLLPTAAGRMKWPWIPAAVLALLGVLMIGVGMENAGIAFGLAMVAVGGYFIFRTVRPR